MRARRFIAALVSIASLPLTGMTGIAAPNPDSNGYIACDRSNGKPKFCTAKTLQFTSHGPTTTQVATLAEELKIQNLAPEPDGALRYVDDARFQKIPTLPELPGDPLGKPDEDGLPTAVQRIDPVGLLRMTVLDAGKAIETAQNAFRAALLIPNDATARVSNTNFELLPASEAIPAPPAAQDAMALLLGKKVPIDTHVSFNLAFGGVPLVGPGSEASVTFDAEGKATSLLYTMRGLTAGGTVKIIPPEDVPVSCAAELAKSIDGPITVTKARLVYYAPPLALTTASRLFPHMQCGGTVTMEDGSLVSLREVIVPATSAVPNVTLQASLNGTQVSASAATTGGTPPYTFTWGSSTTPLVAEGPSVAYTLNPREPASIEEVSVTVTDAQGLVTSATKTLTVPGNIPAAEPIEVRSINRVDVGTEWVDERSRTNVNNWVSANAEAGVPMQFNWGRAAAHERDFKVLSGRTSSYVDDVDLTFYTGHADGNGWVFESTVNDTFLDYRENPSYGMSDLEWLVIGACGPLQDTQGGAAWYYRWGRIFSGLHLMMGYATTTPFPTEEGRTFARYAYGIGRTPIRVHQSWVLTAQETQDAPVIWADMGPVAHDYRWNGDDYFWGRGPVTGDIAPSNISYYWRLTGSA